MTTRTLAASIALILVAAAIWSVVQTANDYVIPTSVDLRKG